HDEVSIVEQDPVRVLPSLHAQRRRTADGAHARLDLVGHGQHLPAVGPARDHEGVGDAEQVPHLEHDGIVTPLRARGLCCFSHPPPDLVQVTLPRFGTYPGAYRPQRRIQCIAPSGTSPSSGRPAAARSRRLLLEMSRRGISTVSTRQGFPRMTSGAPGRLTTTIVASSATSLERCHVCSSAATSPPTMTNSSAAGSSARSCNSVSNV